MTLDRRRHRVDIALDQVIGDDVFELLGECSQHFAFTRDRRRQYAIESGDAIGSDDQQALIVNFVNVAYLAAPMQFQIGK